MSPSSVIYNRLFLVFGIILLLPFAIGFQLFRIQFWEGENLRKLWSKQSVDYISIPAQRGNIYDTNGRLLVSNSVSYDVAIDPLTPTITPAKADTISTILARNTNKSASYYRHKINSAPKGSRYVKLARSLNTSAYEELYSLNLHGIILEEKFDRIYSFENLAAQTLGYLNHEEDGMIGLEAFYNEELKGRDGTQQVRRDKRNNIYAYVGAPKKTPVDGHSLHTTLDAHIQAIVEEELQTGIRQTGSNYGTAIVVEPATGAVRAIANYPTFNPNNPGSSPHENRRNYATSDQIEPGSTFKLVTAVAAIEQNVVELDEIIETPEDGKMKLHGLWLTDHDPLGNLSFREVIQKSSNIGTAKVAMRLKKDTFYQYVRNMGFGTPTNIDLPNEAAGKLKKPYRWSLVTLPWMAHGYEIQTTPLQLIQAYAAFANLGKMKRPYLVEKITDNEGTVIKNFRPLTVRTVTRPETFAKLLPVFESVLADSGTAPWASVNGLSIAGKTGTAKKVENGRYTNSYRASFVGFFPSKNPKYACLVMLDEPQTSIYGGYTAGPVFRNIASRLTSLNKNIEFSFPDDTLQKVPLVKVPLVRGMKRVEAKSILDAQQVAYSFQGEGTHVTGQSIAAGKPVKAGEKMVLQTEGLPQKSEKNLATVPDVTGLSVRKALWIIQEAGFKAHVVNSGTIIGQFPKNGVKLKRGGTVTIRGAAQSMEKLTQKTH